MTKLPATESSAEEVVTAYHERTKHHPHRYAASLGYLDWATQPDPFRRYAGAELLQLPRPKSGDSPLYTQLYVPGGIAPEELSIGSISRFFRYSLALTAWKQSGTTKWPLRANPSSGNLHPTEGYAILPAIDGLSDMPGLYHYAAKEHAFERRAQLDTKAHRDLVASWPVDSFLVGLSSIHWREAWKYGERAFRYCQHDIGHALAALRIAAATLGWNLLVLEGVPSAAMGELLGLNRDRDYLGAECEEPELLAVVVPSGTSTPNGECNGFGTVTLAVSWFGRANPLSSAHAADWPVIDEVARATRRGKRGPIAEDFSDFPSADELDREPARPEQPSAEAIISARRSATAMDGKTAIPQATFFHMLARLLPTRGALAMPWDAIRWRPRIHLGLFVHRVEGLPCGLYALLRDPLKLFELKEVLGRGFLWQRVPNSPPGLPLYLLEQGDCRPAATALSCGQDIAGDGAFSLAMLADFRNSLTLYGASFYRRLFWEAGMVGQVLYLEALAAGIGGTGIGCYFDDQVHGVFGLTSADWQSLYHFTVGGPVEDNRLTTLPAYDFEQPRAD